MNDSSAELVALLAESTGASSIERGEHIQSLWSGYGELFRVHLTGGESPSLVVKWAKPPASGERTASYVRKCRSYDVETVFYLAFAARCDATCRVPRLHAHRIVRGSHPEWTLCLEDLDAAGFSRRIRSPRGHELEACLKWLAHFHARFMESAPDGLWKVGTYWHLATRREELAFIRDMDLKAKAPELDRQLNAARFKTLVHGDAKPANFCFTHDGKGVAAVDFQYVGGSVGTKDVAYLLHGEATRANEMRHLDLYFAHLRAALPRETDGHAVEAEWRALYPAAKEDFQRFLAGWRG